MPEWVCLLRAINLGARNRVGMPQLRKALTAAGFENVRWGPFAEEAAARPTGVHVVHLDAEPEPARVASVLAEDWSPDGLEIRAAEACVMYAATPHRSRLQYPTLLKRLGVGGTARNWRTVTAIADLLSS